MLFRSAGALQISLCRFKPMPKTINATINLYNENNTISVCLPTIHYDVSANVTTKSRIKSYTDHYKAGKRLFATYMDIRAFTRNPGATYTKRFEMIKPSIFFAEAFEKRIQAVLGHHDGGSPLSLLPLEILYMIVKMVY